jgi:hypothetical protein
VRESRSPGSVRGVLSNGHSYRDRSAVSSLNRVRRHLIRNAEPVEQSSGSPGYQFSRKTSCNRVLERLFYSDAFLERISVRKFPFPELTPIKPKPRHAELVVNLAGAMASFLVSTWDERQRDC